MRDCLRRGGVHLRHKQVRPDNGGDWTPVGGQREVVRIEGTLLGTAGHGAETSQRRCQGRRTQPSCELSRREMELLGPTLTLTLTTFTDDASGSPSILTPDPMSTHDSVADSDPDADSSSNRSTARDLAGCTHVRHGPQPDSWLQ